MLGTSRSIRGGLNRYYTARITAAADLYFAGRIDHIIVSGSNPSRYYNEPMAMKKDLMARGVPEERITSDFAGLRTLDSIVRADKDFTKLKGMQIALQALITTIRDTEGVRNCQVILEKEDPDDQFGKDFLTIRILPEIGVDRNQLEKVLKENVKFATEVTPDRIIFESDTEKFETELFARTGIKADFVIEKRQMYL